MNMRALFRSVWLAMLLWRASSLPVRSPPHDHATVRGGSARLLEVGLPYDFDDVHRDAAGESIEGYERIPNAGFAVDAPEMKKHFFDEKDCASGMFVSQKECMLSWQKPVYLASYPCSGNTWARSLLEGVLQIYSGSIYNDTTLKEAGFLGEGSADPRRVFPPPSALIDRRHALRERTPDVCAHFGTMLATSVAGPSLWRESDIVSIDCEMVGVAGPSCGPGSTGATMNALCRVSLVTHSAAGARTCLDTWVDVEEPVLDFRSPVTGIDEDKYCSKAKMKFSEARRLVLKYISGKIVVGHAVWNDFEALKIHHPHGLVRDTALYLPLRPPWRQGRLPSLRLLARHWLHENIQDGIHSSVEDAIVALRLYKMHQAIWEGYLGNVLCGQDGPAAGSGKGTGSGHIVWHSHALAIEMQRSRLIATLEACSSPESSLWSWGED